MGSCCGAPGELPVRWPACRNVLKGSDDLDEARRCKRSMKARSPQERPLWTCPRCGHRFVTRHLWHSCSRHTLAEHFIDKPPHMRELFNSFVAIIERFGPVTVYAQKSRIVCQARV